jgi:hypothetical protein
MKPSLRLGLVLVLMVVTVTIAGVRIQAWNPATHIYIAQKVYPAYAQRTDLWYGAIAPDMAMYVPTGLSWDSAFWDTHWTAIDLRPWAWNTAQRIFAKGWVTHNEMYGADHYAHGYPPLYLAGYVTFRANILAALAHISPDLAHYAIETAVDLRMNTTVNSNLAVQLQGVALTPPPSAQVLLTRALVWWPLQRTDFETLAMTRAAFNGVVAAYALALMNSDLQNYDAIVGFAVWMALQMGMPGTDDELEAQVRPLLKAALDMTADYQTAVNLTIKGVSLSVPK